jgi:hypothetical protein
LRLVNGGSIDRLVLGWQEHGFTWVPHQGADGRVYPYQPFNPLPARLTSPIATAYAPLCGQSNFLTFR